MKKTRLLITGSMVGLAMLSVQPAFAQTTTPDDQADEDQEEVAEEDNAPILVTGSRISRPTLESPVPVTSVTAEDLLSSGNLSVGDALNDLPSLRSTFSQSNSTRFIGTAGLNILDLRGLGTARTLTLVNGRRHVTVSPGDYTVDVNTIPSELIERIDVVTGGNSAIYGSDAIAGVVNFVLKKDFDGLRLTGQGGVSSRGDRGAYFGALTWGKNFADGRGNIAIAAEYSKSNPIKFTGRDYLTGAFSGRKQFNLDEVSTGESPFGDGIFDNQFFTNIRNNNISDGGLLSASCTAATLANPLRCAPGGFPVRYLFDDAGNLIQNPIQRDLRPVGSNNSVGGLGSTLSNYGDLIPEIERASVNLLAHFDVSDAFRPFVEAKYVRLNVFSETSPSFIQGINGDPLGVFSCSNPFLSAANITALQAVGRCTTPTGTISINRNNVDLGIRSEDNTRETWRVVAGVEGTFNDDWKYEVALNYGKLDGKTVSLNNLQLFNVDGSNGPYLNAYDAVLAPAGFSGTNFATNAAGQRVICRINAVTNVDANCVPLNLFGNGRSDPRAVDYVMTDSLYGQKASQFVASAFVGGDFSELFELPGGPIAFALGAEYREEKGSIAVDELTSTGATFLTALQPIKYPKLTVKEAFAELNVPLLRDVPFAQLLEIGAAARISDYNTAAGSTKAYNFTGIWAPIEDVKFRAAYSRSVRVPTQSALFDPIGQNFATIADPCDVLNIGLGPNRAANCAAAGVPAGFVNTPARSATLSIADGGNPLLEEEKSDSYTVGVVIEPSFAPGLSITVDYYDITVKNLIAFPTANLILNACYDSASIVGNPFCAQVNRLPGGLFDDPAVTVFPANFAKFTTKGLDVDLAYNHSFDNGDRFTYRIIGSWLRDRSQYTDPADPRFRNRIHGELGDPIWELGSSFSYKHKDLTLRYEFRYIGPQTVGTWESQHAMVNPCPASGLTGFAAGNAAGQPTTCTPFELALLGPLNADQFPEKYYKAQHFHDLRLNWEVNDKVSFYTGVDNVFDRKPPRGLLGTGAGSGIFDATGRYFYAGIRADF